MELANTVRDEERSYTIGAQCDREGSQPLSTKHSISVGVPSSPAVSTVPTDPLENTKGAKNAKRRALKDRLVRQNGSG